MNGPPKTIPLRLNRAVSLRPQRSNPIRDQPYTFIICDGSTRLGHSDLGDGRFHPMQEKGRFGVARYDGVMASARRIFRRGRLLHDAAMKRIALVVTEIETSVAGEPFGVVAMSAVDVEITEGAGIE